MAGNLANFIEEAQKGLLLQVERSLPDFYAENRTKVEQELESFAYHLGLLNYRLFKQERVETVSSVLQDVLRVGIPQLIWSWRLDQEQKSAFWGVLQSWLSGVFSVAVALGKSYLEGQSEQWIADIQEKINKWQI